MSTDPPGPGVCIIKRLESFARRRGGFQHNANKSPMKATDTANPDYFHKVVDCQWACPAHTDVPGYIRLIAQGRFSDAYLLNRKFGVAHCVAAPSALIGASNFFELAVATAIVLFGFESGAALAPVVGVLVEVPVMLSVVKIVNASKGWYERALTH